MLDSNLKETKNYNSVRFCIDNEIYFGEIVKYHFDGTVDVITNIGIINNIPNIILEFL